MFPLFPLLSKVIQKLRTTQEGKGDTHSPLVAVTTLVSTLTTSVCGPPTFLSVPPRPTATTGICLGRQVISSARMEALMQHYQAAGISREISQQFLEKLSPNKMYDDR